MRSDGGSMHPLDERNRGGAPKTLDRNDQANRLKHCLLAEVKESLLAKEIGARPIEGHDMPLRDASRYD